MTVRADLERYTQEIETIPGGYIKLIDVMGDDARIANTARIATSAEPEEARNKRLIRYLMRHGHTSPFEFCEIHLEVKSPMFVWAQWVRHRTASVNQRSMRANAETLGFFETPEGAWRQQTDENKMGSKGLVEEFTQGLATHLEGGTHKHAQMAYELMIRGGVAHEQARKVLPQDAWTTASWKIDLKNLLGFLRQRLDSHAQQEIRVYAEAIAQIVRQWVPFTWEAFLDYDLYSRRLSAQELRALGRLLRGGVEPDAAIRLTEGHCSLTSVGKVGATKMVKSEREGFSRWIDDLMGVKRAEEGET